MAKEPIAAGKLEAPKFSKEQLIRSSRFSRRRDLLGALLEEGKLYSAEEVEEIMGHYLKGKVI